MGARPVLAAVTAGSCRGALARSFSSTCRRCSRPTATEAAAQLMERFANSGVTRRQLIDANQVQKLALMLGRRSLGSVDMLESPPPSGTPLPPGYHLVYFTPASPELELGPDGSDKTFNSQAPFTRRMWAGGKMKWAGGKIQVGDEAEERTELLSATAKRSKAGGEMVLVEVEKQISSRRGLSVVDRRSWIFRPELQEAIAVPPESPSLSTQATTTIADVTSEMDRFPIRQMRWSPVGLFRFSALTFNGHQIHYNEDWAQMMEGHPGVVVHGPLNLINILDYWRDVHGKGRDIGEVSYRAMAPLYAGEEYHIRTGEVEKTGHQKAYQILVEKGGVVCMKADILEAEG